MANRHTYSDLLQMQSLPLSAKERMSTERIKIWFESWNKYKIVNMKTGRITYKTALDYPRLTKNQFIESVESGSVYVSLSGGKDSTVLTDLTARFCKTYGYKLVLLFINTGLEYPEIQKHVKVLYQWLIDRYGIEIELHIIRPEMRFDEVIKEYGYPVISKEVSQIVREARIGLENNDGSYEFRIKKLNGELKDKNGNISNYNIPQYKYLLDIPIKISEECCKVMKKDPAKKFEKESGGRKPIIGTMATESRLRRQRWIRYGCNAFDSGKKRGPSSNPLSFWTEQDILEYIVKYNLPLASVYKEIKQDEKTGKYYLTGAKRTGCMFCMFGAHCKGDRRSLDMKETHPRQYDYCINGGAYKWRGYVKSTSEWHELDFLHDDGTPFSESDIEEYIEKHKNDDNYKFIRLWGPGNGGLGCGKVLDSIGASDKY